MTRSPRPGRRSAMSIRPRRWRRTRPASAPTRRRCARPRRAAPMDGDVRDALERGRPLIDIRTTGRRTGEPRRLEIVYHRIGGRIYISGSPVAERTRAWLLNLAADPQFTFHLKGRVSADLPATARIITDDAERRAIFAEIVKVWTNQDIETMTRYAPLIEVTLDGLAA